MDESQTFGGSQESDDTFYLENRRSRSRSPFPEPVEMPKEEFLEKRIGHLENEKIWVMEEMAMNSDEIKRLTRENESLAKEINFKQKEIEKLTQELEVEKARVKTEMEEMQARLKAVSEETKST